ncbi:MAG: AbrB/MazE/SpoVT family DNA-binding domain-containing protein [Alphaproteobacteria bacterium]|nr:AbrB/MazE/SpoVT family DNA-binding domain-containing protein [Alphaproteobacteria bacterium]
MTDTATLSSKFQISVPKAVREKTGWKAGQKLVFLPKGNGLLLVPIPDRAALAGSMRGAGTDDLRDRANRF